MTSNMKTTLKKIRGVLAGAALIVLGAGAANADSISFTNTFSNSTDFTHTFTLNKFDTGLGVLTGVELDLYGTLSTPTLTLQNLAPTSESFRFTANAELFTAGNTASVDELDTLPTPGNIITLSTGPITLGVAGSGACANSTPTGACDTVSYAPLTVNNVLSPATTTVAVARFGGYEVAGAGTFNIDGSTSTGDNFTGGGGNIRFSQVTSASVTAKVIYTYTAALPTGAPEPASMLLLGSALLGLGLLGKRLKRA
jgi:hypothetical protein